MMNFNPNIKTPAELQPGSCSPDGEMIVKCDKSNFVVRVFFDHQHGHSAHDLIQRYVTERIASAN